MPRPSTYKEGAVFTRLTVIAKLPGNRALCRCVCGTEKAVNLRNLNNGKTRSCGCLHKELAAIQMKRVSTRHGLCGSVVYIAWQQMLQRCTNPKHHAYKDYGARGITVCARWQQFENFLADMGQPAPAMTLERKDNDSGYEPDNCIWAPRFAQANNRRSCVYLTFNGETKNISQWAAGLGVNRYMLYSRHDAGWPVERILTTPSRTKP